MSSNQPTSNLIYPRNLPYDQQLKPIIEKPPLVLTAEDVAVQIDPQTNTFCACQWIFP